MGQITDYETEEYRWAGSNIKWNISLLCYNNNKKRDAIAYTRFWRQIFPENTKFSEREIKKSVPFTTATISRIKYLGINLPKETKELYTENYKALMKELKDNINR